MTESQGYIPLLTSSGYISALPQVMSKMKSTMSSRISLLRPRDSRKVDQVIKEEGAEKVKKPIIKDYELIYNTAL